jgi:hypothetical protein
LNQIDFDRVDVLVAGPVMWLTEADAVLVALSLKEPLRLHRLEPG